MPTLTGGGGRDTSVYKTDHIVPKKGIGKGPDKGHSPIQDNPKSEPIGKLGQRLSRGLKRDRGDQPNPDREAVKGDRTRKSDVIKPQPIELSTPEGLGKSDPSENVQKMPGITNLDKLPSGGQLILLDGNGEAKALSHISVSQDGGIELPSRARLFLPLQGLNATETSGSVSGIGKDQNIQDDNWIAPKYIALKDLPDGASILRINAHGELTVPESLPVTKDGFLELPSNPLVLVPAGDDGSYMVMDLSDKLVSDPPSVLFNSQELAEMLGQGNGKVGDWD